MKQVITTIAVFLATFASSQWTVVNLHPAWAAESSAYGVRDGQQVGSAYAGDYVHAGLWSGTAGSWVDLHPDEGETSGSEAIGVYAGQQVGHGSVNGSGGACLWSGTAGSWLNLHPAGATYSYAMGVDAGKQVGVAGFGGREHAGMWSSTAGSWVDLHPAGATRSGAQGVDAGQQAGDATVGGVTRASLWSGSAGTWVDLHPAGSTESVAWGLHGGQQVGWAFVGGVERASLWSGTAASWVNLHPVGSTSSRAFGVHGGQQVGWAVVGGLERASLWNGTAASWVDLSRFVPTGFTSLSQASGIWHDGAFTYVVGRARRSSGNNEALMWVSRAVAPVSYSMFRGSVISGNLASLQNSDNNRLVMRPGAVFSNAEPPIQVILNATAPTSSPSGFSFSLESNASIANAEQKISLYNYVSGQYEVLDTRLATTSDDTVNVNVTSNTSRFIQAGTLAIRARVTYRALGSTFVYPWHGRIDRAWWTFPS